MAAKANIGGNNQWRNGGINQQREGDINRNISRK